MLGSAVFSVDRSEKYTILVKSEHEDFPGRGDRSAELLVFPKQVGEVLDLTALSDMVAKAVGAVNAEISVIQSVRAEEESLGGILPDLSTSMLSFAIRHGLGLPYKKSALKVLVPAPQLKPNPSNNLERLLLFRPEPIIPLDYYKILDIPGISGEWFVGKIRGVVSHVVTGLGEGLSPRTGLASQTGTQTAGLATAFLLETGYTLIPCWMKVDVPLREGEVTLLRGWVDREHSNVKVSSILKFASLEMWSLV